jgi:hypothetical protein
MKLQSNLSFTGVAPLVMSGALCLLLAIGAVVPLGPEVPIHDEYARDHIGMLLLFGQVPIILCFVVLHRHQGWTSMSVLALQLSLLAGALLIVHHGEQARRDFVARRMKANRPIAGSEAALRRVIQAEQQGRAWRGLSADLFVTQYARDNEEAMRGKLASFGALRSLAFAGVDRIGWDTYDARFANGNMEWSIYMTPNGLIHGLAASADQYGCLSSEVYECRPPGRAAY